MTAIDVMQLLLGGALLFAFLIIALVNWGVFLAFVFRRIPSGRSVSSLPFIGSVFGCGGFAVMPLAWFNHHWWLPLFLDFGCIPGVLLLAITWPFRKRKTDSIVGGDNH